MKILLFNVHFWLFKSPHFTASLKLHLHLQLEVFLVSLRNNACFQRISSIYMSLLGESRVCVKESYIELLTVIFVVWYDWHVLPPTITIALSSYRSITCNKQADVFSWTQNLFLENKYICFSFLKRTRLAFSIDVLCQGYLSNLSTALLSVIVFERLLLR